MSSSTLPPSISLSSLANATANTCNATFNISTIQTFNLSTHGAIFENTPAIVSGHADTPRMGHTNNITLALTSSQAEAKDYIVGLTVSAIIMFIFFAIWAVVIIVFKCLGYKVVGFLSGSNVTIPSRPPGVAAGAAADKGTDNNNHNKSEGFEQEGDEEDKVLHSPEEEQDDGDEQENDDTEKGNDNENDNMKANVNASENDNMNEKDGWECERNEADQELAAWEKLVQRREFRIQTIRLVVIFSGLIIVIMAILMIVYGIQGLNRSFGSTLQGIEQGENLSLSGIELINAYLTRQNSTLAAAQEVMTASSGVLCEQAKAIICSDAAAQTGFNCTAVFDQFPTILNKQHEFVTKITETKYDLNELASLLNELNATLARFNWAFWVAAGAVILLAVSTLMILNGVILAWRKKLHGTCWQRATSRFRGWFIVPIFAVLLLIGFVFSMVFVIGSTATADFCYDSPNANILALLYENEDKFQGASILFQSLVYYVSGCPGNSQIHQLAETVFSTLLTYLALLSQAISLISKSTDLIAAECNQDPAVLASALDGLEAMVCSMISSCYSIMDYFSCQNFNGLYATVFYDAVCYNGNSGFAWISTTQFIIIFFSMIMLTLRVAFYELVDESELMQPRGCCGCCKRGGNGGGGKQMEVSPPDDELQAEEEDEAVIDTVQEEAALDQKFHDNRDTANADDDADDDNNDDYYSKPQLT